MDPQQQLQTGQSSHVIDNYIPCCVQEIFQEVLNPLGGTSRTMYLHLQDAVALLDARLLRRSILQNGAHVLQRCVELPVDGPQLAALGHLAAHIKAEARFRFVDGDHARPVGGGYAHDATTSSADAATGSAAADHHCGGGGDDGWWLWEAGGAVILANDAAHCAGRSCSLARTAPLFASPLARSHWLAHSHHFSSR